MKRKIAALLLCIFMTAGSIMPVQASFADSITKIDTKESKEIYQRVEDEVIVIYEDEMIDEKKLDFDGIVSQEEIMEAQDGNGSIAVLSLEDDVSVEDAVKELEKEDGIKAVQENYVYQLMDVSANDPDVKKQYYLKQSDVARAWNELPKNGTPVTVAVLDTGINYEKSRRHEDLQDVSDGGNVYYDYGYNAYTQKRFGERGWFNERYYYDFVGHGTSVASVIGAQVNNSKGMAGAGYQTRILPVNVFDQPARDDFLAIQDADTGTVYYGFSAMAYTKTIVTAYEYVLAHADELNIRVVNLSLAGEGVNDQILQDVIDRAYDKGIVTVAAAGNDGSKALMYPASLDHVISVGSVSDLHTWSDFSQYNKYVDFCAPGEDIRIAKAGRLAYYDMNEHIYKNSICYLPEVYTSGSGTSYSAPIVSSIAAMMCSVKPSIQASKILSILKSTSMDLGPSGYDNYFGYGEVNAYYGIMEAKGKSYTKDYKVSTVTFDEKNVKLKTAAYTYSGKEKKPAVSVTVKDHVLLEGKTDSNGNISLSYASGRKKVGTYTVKVTGFGKVSGSVKLSFKINPVATTISSLSGKSKSFKASWKKQATQVSGYQLRYSTSSSMKKPKTVTVSGYKTTTKTIKKLKAKTNYYVQVRTYKTVDQKKYYSAWSVAKKVKTK